MGAPDEPDGPRRDDRYEPLPGLAALPRWAWTRMGRAWRIAVVVALLAAVAAAIPLALSVSESKRERAASERREHSRLAEQRIRELRVEQRPRAGRSGSVPLPGAAPREQLVARARVLRDLTAAVGADARRRVRSGALQGPIRRVVCEPFPRSLRGRGADANLEVRRGRYSCVAATAEFGRGAASVGGLIGHPYRAMVDFRTGRYALCKISGRPGPTADPRVTTPPACGGRR